MTNKLPLFFLLFLFSFPCISQDSLVVEILKKNTHPVQLKDGQITGEGLDFLQNTAKENNFFLIGESHGIADVPQFVAALFDELQKEDFQYFATETGPYTAEMIQGFAGTNNWKNDFQKLFKEKPFSLPFYSWQEEAVMLYDIVNGQNKIEVWGLDQEFAASYRMFFQQLRDNAPNEEAKKLAASYYEKAEQSFKESFESKNPGKSFLGQARPDDFAALKKAFEGDERSIDLIKELEESTQIYQMWFTREGYRSNVTRAEMMKRHFWNYYSSAKKAGNTPKVLFKFGANHIYRGRNALNVYDIGNFVSEVASQEGTSSFHLMLLATSGTQNAYTPFSQSKDDMKKAITLDEEDLEKYQPVLDAAPQKGWALLDLRPLRVALFNKQIKNLDKGLEKLIWSYDAVLVMDEVTAATNF